MLYKMNLKNFDLPEWTNERNIYIFAGIEIFMKRDMGKWYKKIQRCNKCGKCCMNVPDKWPHGKDMKTGNCQCLVYRANEWLCELGLNRPFSCCVGEGEENICNIKWEEC